MLHGKVIEQEPVTSKNQRIHQGKTSEVHPGSWSENYAKEYDTRQQVRTLFESAPGVNRPARVTKAMIICNNYEQQSGLYGSRDTVACRTGSKVYALRRTIEYCRRYEYGAWYGRRTYSYKHNSVTQYDDESKYYTNPIGMEERNRKTLLKVDAIKKKLLSTARLWSNVAVNN